MSNSPIFVISCSLVHEVNFFIGYVRMLLIIFIFGLVALSSIPTSSRLLNDHFRGPGLCTFVVGCSHVVLGGTPGFQCVPYSGLACILVRRCPRAHSDILFTGHGTRP